jgi:predicted lipoprotein with Yx(FWY)xxD motif
MIRIDARLLGIAGVAAIALAACGGGGNTNNSGSSNNQPAKTNSVVSFKNTSGAGKVLVNSNGMTLYSADQEKNGKIMCTGACTGFWQPLTVSGKTVAKPAGFTGTLATIKRPDNGKTQVTYNGSPLYTFRLDSSTGQTKGNNFSDAFGGTKFTWHAAGSTKSSGTSNGGNNNNGGGYNYGGY